HDEALYYHGLIDREPIQKTITVYTGYGTAALVNDGIKVFTLKKDLLVLGKMLVENSYGI
ncbi:MAG: abortive phage infection protein, partial [Lachnospiraceae bacterium]|nr:abortive phage infection protein [Lachnospiraceae bacterium]